MLINEGQKVKYIGSEYPYLRNKIGVVEKDHYECYILGILMVVEERVLINFGDTQVSHWCNLTSLEVEK